MVDAKKLAEGKNDFQLTNEATKLGLVVLACAWEGIPVPTEPGTLSTTDFSRENPWAHVARVNNAIKVVTRQVPRSNKAGATESVSSTGEILLAIERVFKGE